MKIGGHLLCEDFDLYMEAAEHMDRGGYVRLWSVDSQMLWEDAYIYAAYMLERTERIQFGTAVSNPITRHYSVSASAMATLERRFPGRTILGIGRGDSAVRTLGYRPLSTSKIEPILVKTKQLLNGETADEDGTEIRLRWLPEGGHRIPLMYGATGPKNLRIGGAVADIVMLQVGTHPAAVSWAIDLVRKGAEAAGRDPESVEISLLCGMWVSNDRDEARNECRWAASCASNHLEDVARAGGEQVLPDELRKVLKAERDRYDYYAGHLDSHADHSEYLSDELIDEFSINGPADECLEKISVLAELGVSEISAAYLNGHVNQIDLVSEQIIPRLARA